MWLRTIALTFEIFIPDQSIFDVCGNFEIDFRRHISNVQIAFVSNQFLEGEAQCTTASRHAVKFTNVLGPSIDTQTGTLSEEFPTGEIRLVQFLNELFNRQRLLHSRTEFVLL